MKNLICGVRQREVIVLSYRELIPFVDRRVPGGRECLGRSAKVRFPGGHWFYASGAKKSELQIKTYETLALKWHTSHRKD